MHDTAITTGVVVADGLWHHLCVAWSTMESLVVVALDGQSGIDAATRSPSLAFHVPSTAPLESGGCFTIGQLALPEDTTCALFDPAFTYEGYLNELTLWTSLLPQSQVENRLCLRPCLCVRVHVRVRVRACVCVCVFARSRDPETQATVVSRCFLDKSSHSSMLHRSVIA